MNILLIHRILTKNKKFFKFIRFYYCFIIEHNIFYTYIDDLIISCSFLSEYGHLRREGQDMLAHKSLLNFLLHIRHDSRIQLRDTLDDIHQLRITLKSIQRRSLLPLHHHLPTGFLSQLLQLVVQVEIVTNIGYRLSQRSFGLHGEVQKITVFLITPHRHTQQTFLIGDLVHRLHHLVRISSVHKDQITDNSVELVGRLEHALPVMDPDLQTLPLHPFVKIVLKAQFIGIASQIIPRHLHHLLTEISRQVSALLILEAQSIGNHLTNPAPNFVDVLRLGDLHHAGESVVEGLHSRIKSCIDGSQTVPHDLELLYRGVFGLVQHGYLLLGNSYNKTTKPRI